MFDANPQPRTCRQGQTNDLPPILEARDVNVWHGARHALVDVSFDVRHGEILAFTGPSGCGKSTAFKCLNRDFTDQRDVFLSGVILMNNRSIHANVLDRPLQQRKFGWVARRPDPFPTSIYHNVAYPALVHGLTRNKADLDAHVKRCLERVHLWDGVKDVLRDKKGRDLPHDMQMRLCIARALAAKPQVLLMDDPFAPLGADAQGAMQELLLDLRRDHAMVIVTDTLDEARPVADRVAYFHLGRLLVLGPVEEVATRIGRSQDRTSKAAADRSA